MKVVALISGGKDSCYNMMQCVAEGHEIVALANLHPEYKDELDSYMFQTVGHHAIELYADAMDLPLYRRIIKGSSVSIGAVYNHNDEDEVEDLFHLLKEVKNKENIEAVSVGAILSDYQRVRVENVCNRLGLTPLAYLWRRDQVELLREMIDCGVNAIIIKVASWGLEPRKFLGASLKTAFPDLMKLKDRCGLNVCGEGGEYETFTLDCPLFNKRLQIITDEMCIESDDPMSPVGYMNLKKLELVEKHNLDINWTHEKRLLNLPMKQSCNLPEELELLNISNHDRENSEQNSKEFTTMDSVDSSILKHMTCQKSSQSIHISGLYGCLEKNRTVTEVTHDVLDRLKQLLREQLFLMSDSVVMHLYVKKMDYFAEINAAYTTYFSVNPPARICVETLLPDSVVVQIDCYACKCSTRKTMHVQGLSHWAPANIGPYSQAVQIDERIFVAGQIGLSPSSLTLIPGGIQHESRLSLRHVERILKAMHSPLDIGHIVLMICYVTDVSHIQVARSEWIKTLQSSEEESDLFDDETPRTLLEFVVVSHLPKSALVEWQLYSDIDIKSYQAVVDTKTISCFNVDVEIHHQEEKLGAMLVKASCSQNNSINQDDISSLLDWLLMNYVDNYSLSPSWTMFYCHGKIKLSTLQKAVEDILKKFTSVPAISFVPVLCFQTSTQVISICV